MDAAPFRFDHVGSLLRPQRVKDARARFARGEITAAELQRVESLEIGKIVQKQKQSGLRLATDVDDDLHRIRHARSPHEAQMASTGASGAMFLPDMGLQCKAIETILLKYRDIFVESDEA